MTVGVLAEIQMDSHLIPLDADLRVTVGTDNMGG